MEHRPPSFPSRVLHFLGLGLRLPPPSGPQKVKSLYFRIPGEHGVLTQIFYPSQTISSSCDDKNGPKSDTPQESPKQYPRAYRNGIISGFSHFSKTPKFVLDMFLGAAPHPLNSLESGEEGREIQHVPVESRLPVIYFSHGLGGNAEVYSKTAMDCASHGFVVIAMEHEDGSGSYAKTKGGEVVTYRRPPTDINYTREEVIAFRKPFLEKRENEIRQVVNFFTESEKVDASVPKEVVNIMQCIDHDKAVLAGHSFGAASTVHTVRAWPNRFKAALLLDLWPFPVPDLHKGIKNIPVLSVLSESFADNDESTLTKTLLANCNQLVGSFYLPGTVHSSFSDTPWWIGSPFLSRKLLLAGSVNPELAQLSMVSSYVTFLKEVLDPEAFSMTTDFQARMLKRDQLLKEFSANVADVAVT